VASKVITAAVGAAPGVISCFEHAVAKAISSIMLLIRVIASFIDEWEQEKMEVNGADKIPWQELPHHYRSVT
jgi:hypothetical protein